MANTGKMFIGHCNFIVAAYPQLPRISDFPADIRFFLHTFIYIFRYNTYLEHIHIRFIYKENFFLIDIAESNTDT